MWVISSFRSARPLLTSRVSIETNMQKCNISRYHEQVEPNAINAIHLKQRPKVAYICRIEPNKFWDWLTALGHRPFNSYGRNVVLPVTNIISFSDVIWLIDFEWCLIYYLNSMHFSKLLSWNVLRQDLMKWRISEEWMISEY